jgi:hypothetical protein
MKPDDQIIPGAGEIAWAQKFKRWRLHIHIYINF